MFHKEGYQIIIFSLLIISGLIIFLEYSINNIEVMGPVDSPLLKIKKKFRSRLLIRYNNDVLAQKKIEKLLNNLKISSKIKLMVDVDPINFA